MENVPSLREEDEQIDLPAGFRFHPTDEELITHYLSQKVLNGNFSARAIGEVDLNKSEPWELPWRAKMGEKEWYFFCVRDRKYPTGLRTNRATDSGYWKATGKDKEIYKRRALVGMKKTLVFYKGRAPKGERTDWVMHEYRLEGKYSVYSLPKTAKNDWVICRVFKKISAGKKTHISGLPPLMDSSPYNNRTRFDVGETTTHATCFSNPMEEHETKEDMADGFNTGLAAASSSSPNPSYNFSYAPNTSYHSNTGNFQFSESILMHDQSILRMLLENHDPMMKRNTKAEFFSPETGFSTDISSAVADGQEMVQRSFGDQENPSSSAGPGLWSYQV